MADNKGFKGRSIGNNEGLGTGDLPMPKGFSGGSDDFYVQYINRTDGSYEYEAANGSTVGLHDCCEDDDY